MQRRNSALVLAALLLPACSAGSTMLSNVLPVPASQQLSSSEMPEAPSPASLLAQLDNDLATSTTPPGIDAALWQELCTALRSAVHERDSGSGTGAATFSLDDRSVSFTPYGTQNMVRDLTLSGSGPWLLSWSYRNSGDYDLNGSVTISDLTPIGQSFGMRDSDPLWFLAMHADGDGNGEINIADVTPIGQNFGGSIIGYAVYGTDDLAGEWTHLGNATVATNLHRNSDRLRFVIRLESLEYTNYALWPYDNSDDEGGWSNPAALGTAPARSIRGIRSLLEE